MELCFERPATSEQAFFEPVGHHTTDALPGSITGKTHVGLSWHGAKLIARLGQGRIRPQCGSRPLTNADNLGRRMNKSHAA
jgi:hypothetical protein